MPEGGGRFVSDISDTLDQKLQAIRQYESQFPVNKQRVFQLVESQNRLLGTSAGFEAGEMLIAATTLGLRNVFDTICGPQENL